MKKSAKNAEEVIDTALNQKKKSEAESIGLAMVKKMIQCYEKAQKELGNGNH